MSAEPSSDKLDVQGELKRRCNLVEEGPADRKHVLIIVVGKWMDRPSLESFARAGCAIYGMGQVGNLSKEKDTKNEI